MNIQSIVADLSQQQIYIFTDFDGTLATFVSNPKKALPHPLVKTQLLELINKNNIPVIFITGRPIAEFDSLFAAETKTHLNVIGQHGIEKRINGKVTSNIKDDILKYINSLKAEAQNFIKGLRQKYNLHHDITLLEIKPYSFAFHWRALQKINHTETNNIVKAIEIFLKEKIRPNLAAYSLQILSGDMNYEVQTQITKGEAIIPTLNKLPKEIIPIFLCDDLDGTDGSAAEVIRKQGGYVIQVKNDKPKHRLATHTVASPAALGYLLRTLNTCFHKN